MVCLARPIIRFGFDKIGHLAIVVYHGDETRKGAPGGVAYISLIQLYIFLSVHCSNFSIFYTEYLYKFFSPQREGEGGGRRNLPLNTPLQQRKILNSVTLFLPVMTTNWKGLVKLN